MAGSIKRRGLDSWRLTYDVGRNEAGRRIRRTQTVRGSKKEADARLTELLSKRDQGIDVEPNKLTLATFLTQWLQNHQVEPQSRARYEQLIRLHVLPSLGATRITALKPLHIQNLLTSAEQSVSPSTAHDVFTVLNMALAQAVRWQLLVRNPALSVERPKVEPTEAMRVLTPEEIGRLIESCEHHPLGPLVSFSLATGVRRGEALALSWSNVDLVRGAAEIVESARYQPGVGIVYGPTKTKKSRRTVALSNETVETLTAYRSKQNALALKWGPAWGNSRRLVFTHANGEPFSLGSFNRDFAKLVATARIEGRLRFHDLRHTHGTLLAAAGVNPKVVSDRLGHSDVKFTLNRYVNPTHDHQREAAEAFSNLLKRAR